MLNVKQLKYVRLLTEILNGKQITQQDVADELEVTKQAVNNWESGRIKPRKGDLYLWNEYMNKYVKQLEDKLGKDAFQESLEIMK